jgi:hypothetical protein
LGTPFRKKPSFSADRLWREALRRAVLEPAEGEESNRQGASKLDKAARALVDKATAGDMAAARELGDRLDGKATQAAESAGDDGVDEILAAMRERARKLRAER